MNVLQAGSLAVQAGSPADLLVLSPGFAEVAYGPRFLIFCLTQNHFASACSGLHWTSVRTSNPPSRTTCWGLLSEVPSLIYTFQ